MDYGKRNFDLGEEVGEEDTSGSSNITTPNTTQKCGEYFVRYGEEVLALWYLAWYLNISKTSGYNRLISKGENKNDQNRNTA